LPWSLEQNDERRQGEGNRKADPNYKRTLVRTLRGNGWYVNGGRLRRSGLLEVRFVPSSGDYDPDNLVGSFIFVIVPKPLPEPRHLDANDRVSLLAEALITAVDFCRNTEFFDLMHPAFERLLAEIREELGECGSS
jgi:hypothetical protein